MIFNIGSSAMSAQVNIFSDMFSRAFAVKGVVTQVEVATALALNTYGTEVAGYPVGPARFPVTEVAEGVDEKIYAMLDHYGIAHK